MYLDPEERIRHNRDGKPVLLPNPSMWPYTPAMIDAIADRHDHSVLITGPTGCGKEELAGVLADKKKKFVPINCAGLEEKLIDSELFGHKMGAFTGALANREGILLSVGDGTVFLDEIGRLPLESQAKLLRYMQTGEIRPVGEDKIMVPKVRARIIAATNQQVHSTARFLPDLLHRFDSRIELPPLADRGADALYLLTLPAFAPMGGMFDALSLGTACSVLLYQWPGNIRELIKFKDYAQKFQHVDSREPFDPWPDHVLYIQPQDNSAAQRQMYEPLEEFCKFSIYVLTRLIADYQFISDMEFDQYEHPERFQRTAAILQSIPWILTRSPFNSIQDPNEPHPSHPLILPFSIFQSSSHQVKYDLSSVIRELTGFDDEQNFDPSQYGPLRSEPLPHFLEVLVRLYHEYNSLSQDINCIDFIGKFTFQPHERALLEKVSFSVPAVHLAVEDEFVQVLARSGLGERDENVCRKTFKDKQAGISPKATAQSLNMGASTLRARIYDICRDSPSLKKYIWTPPGRPKTIR